MKLTLGVNKPVVYWFLMLGMGLVAAGQAEELSSKRVAKEYDMQALSHEAQTLRVPILIEFSLVHCEYCKRLEADYLVPMAASNEYKGKVLIRRVVIDEELSLRDFTGDTLAVDQFSKRYRVDVTPTLVLLDYAGSQIGKKLIGYTDTGFYGGQLDDLINDGLMRLRRAAAN